MGFEKATCYNTTSDYNNQHMNVMPKQSQQMRTERLQEQRDRVQKNRMPHYDFGRDMVNYQSMAKNNYQAHDLSQAHEAKIERSKNSNDVRKSHFVFGTDVNPHHKVAILPNAVQQVGTMRSSQQVSSKSSSIVTGPRNDATKTNISISHQGVAAGPVGHNRFTSTYGSQNSLKVQPKSLAAKLQSRVSAHDVSMAYSSQETPGKSAKNSTKDLQIAHFSFGEYKSDGKSQNQANYGRKELPQDQVASRAELKARMAKTQFSFGNRAQDNRQMESMYTSGIDAQAKIGGRPSDGQSVKKELKSTHFSIGAKGAQMNESSEAASQFKARSRSTQNKQSLERYAQLAQKLKGHNFTIQEQKQGGQVNNYFQTSNSQNFGSMGNPNLIRSKIPEGQLADNRSQHYYLGFDQNSFTARGQLSNSFKDSRNAAQRANNSTGGVKIGSLLTGADIERAQKTTHITMGGAPSKQVST